MPVPVYLVFSVHLLAESGALFSRGRLGPGATIGESASFLRETCFADIYHDTGVGKVGDPDRKSHIINARNSEVLFLDELPLDHLRYVVIRSSPERETLLSLLLPNVARQWSSRIVPPGNKRMFYKRGTFVQQVDLGPTTSRLSFYANILPEWRGPFHLRIDWEGSEGWSESYEDRDFTIATHPLTITLRRAQQRYTTRVRMNGDLVYLGTFVYATEPALLS